MSTNLRFVAIAAFSAALAMPALSAARGDDEYGVGTSHEALVRQSALSSENIPVVSRLASTVPTVDGKRDLVGDGGAQDQLANEIYQLGQAVSVGE